MSTPQPAQRIALIGLGAIGQSVAEQLLAHSGDFQIVAVLVQDRAAALAALPELAPHLVDDLTGLLEARPDCVVECAGHGAVDALADPVLRAGCDLVLVSVGALADAQRAERLQATAREAGRQLLLVSGAIGGLDWLGAAAGAGLREVTYRGRKPPRAWRGTEAEGLLDLGALAAPACFFRGSAREAASRYPLNANVAASVGLAALGLDRTMVELWADPTVHENVHEVEADGEAGHLLLRLNNRPDPRNPRTSAITAHSVLRRLLQRRAPLGF